MDGYYAWMLVATALVLMMTTPALALFYGGMTRAKSVLNMMMMSYIAMAIVGIVYVLWGWSMSFGGQRTARSSPTRSRCSVSRTSRTDNYIYVMFQLTFAVITAALISGAIADRVKLSAWIVFLPLWVTLSYFPLAHMVFSCTDAALICTKIGAQDYAGGTAVHINAGVAGLVLALIIGKRVGFGRDPMRPHNLPLTMIGAGLLWVGWYGFNVGSIVFGDDWSTEDGAAANLAQFYSETGRTFTNTTLATMAAHARLAADRAAAARQGHHPGCRVRHRRGSGRDHAGVWCRRHRRCHRASVSSPVAVCAWAVGLKYKFDLDDSLDVVGVHLVGGIVGTVLIGLFSTAEGAGGVDGLFYGGGFGSLGDQTLGALVAIAWSGVFTAIIAFAIKYTHRLADRRGGRGRRHRLRPAR